MNPRKDYTQRTWLAVAALLAVLGGMSLIPPCSVCGITLRRTNILSDVIRFEEATAPAPAREVLLNEEEFHVDLARVAEQVVAVDTLPHEVPATYAWQLGPVDTAAALPRLDSALLATTVEGPLVPVESFDTLGHSPLRPLYEKMLDGRPVRIAVLGDSFIEGDILTADLRECLQTRYGGSGAGFAPMASPLTGFRRTVKTQSKGWTAHNLMQYKSTPQSLRNSFFISGWVCQPAAGAQTRWECTDARRGLDPCAGARILFLSPGDSRMEVVVNDTLRRQFRVEGTPALRQIVIEGLPIHSLAFRVVEGSDGFIGYGALLEGPGVNVDNYSIRSNNGQALFRTSPTVNAQAHALLGYDLVVLQYGLNIMQQGIRNYANYGAQVAKMIAYVKQCFPTAGVLVLGVSDRSVRTDNGFEPMDAIPYMIRSQREAARQENAAFWDTAAAMRSMGGMERFVANGWAGKDYTHINYAGGRQVARVLAAALHEGVRSTAALRKRERIREEMRRILDDSLHRAVRNTLFAPAAIR